MSRVRFLFLILLAITPMSAALAADIGVSPDRVSLTVASGGSASANETLFNSSDRPIRMLVSVADWTQSSDGTVRFLPADSTPTSASAWLTPSASSVIIPAHGQTTVRLGFSVPNKPALAGTYRTVVFFATQATPSTKPGAHFLTVQRFGVIAYVTIAGTETKGSKLTDMYLDGKKLTLDVKNLGNTLMRLGGRVEIRDDQGTTVATLPVNDLPVLRGADRTVALALPKGLAPGYYVALAVLTDSRGGSMAGQLPVQIGN